MIEFILAHLYLTGVLISSFLFALDRAITYEERKEKRILDQISMTQEEKKKDDENESYAIIVLLALSWISVFYILGDFLGKYIIKRNKRKKNG